MKLLFGKLLPKNVQLINSVINKTNNKRGVIDSLLVDNLEVKNPRLIAN